MERLGAADMIERAICTVITKNYLAHARMLADSIEQHNHGLKLYVLLADEIDDYFDPKLENFELIPWQNLPDQEQVKKMLFYYSPFELCCALRGLLHEYMYEVVRAKEWIFLDSDIKVFGSLDPAFQNLSMYSISLTAHSTKSVDIKFAANHETDILISGMYNAGFLGLRRDENAKLFINWFKSRLSIYCCDERSKGMFVDQLWLNFAPLYFQNVGLLKEPGANIGHWNIHEKEIHTNNDGTIKVDGSDLMFVHFSGLDLHDLGHISKHNRKLYEGQDLEFWKPLAQSYSDSLMKFGYLDAFAYPYKYGFYKTGMLIKIEERRAYYHNMTNGTHLPLDPFEKGPKIKVRKMITVPLMKIIQNISYWLKKQYNLGASNRPCKRDFT